MDDVAVVEDRLAAGCELQAGRELAGLLGCAEAVAGQAVGPLVGAAQGLWAETLDERGLEETRHSAADGAQTSALPPQLGDLAGCEEAVARERDEDLEVARLECDVGLRRALAPFEELALGEL